LIDAVDYWNNFLGGYIHASVLVPLRIFNILFTAVTPAYNFVTWVASQFAYQSLLPGAMRNTRHLLSFASATSDLFKHSFVGLADYVPTFAYGCEARPRPLCNRPANWQISYPILC
jgi:hypothetical protein